jgi:hypothetical protein
MRKKISVYLSEYEIKRLRVAAEHKGLRLATYARDVVNAAVDGCITDLNRTNRAKLKYLAEKHGADLK